LSPAVPVDFIECFATMCSVRILVSALKDVSSLDSVQLCLQPGFSTVISNPRTNIGTITSEGDVAMFSNLEPTKYAVNGSGRLIVVRFDPYNCKGGAASDISSGDLPNAVHGWHFVPPITDKRVLPRVFFGWLPRDVT
jgi:hypothetical protein